MLLEDLIENESNGEPSHIGEGFQPFKLGFTNAKGMPLLPSLFHGASFLAHYLEYSRASVIFKRNNDLCLTVRYYRLLSSRWN